MSTSVYVKVIVCIQESSQTECDEWTFFITSLFCIQASPKVTIDRGGCSVHKNGCAQHGSSPAERNETDYVSIPVKSITPSVFGLYAFKNNGVLYFSVFPTLMSKNSNFLRIMYFEL